MLRTAAACGIRLVAEQAAMGGRSAVPLAMAAASQASLSGPSWARPLQGLWPSLQQFASSAAAPARQEEPAQNPLDYGRGFIAPHPGMTKPNLPAGEDMMGNANEADGCIYEGANVYTSEYLESIKPRHLPAAKMYQKVAFGAIQAVRKTFDVFTGYTPDKPMSEAKWLQRMVFLETIAGVPGMVAGMLRHLKSLRSMERDYGWIGTLLEEAENERMHLLTFLKLRQPGAAFRGMVILGQGVFFNFYFVAYLISPKLCHSMVGYLEEEAVKTYTHCLNDMDAGLLPQWENKVAPELAQLYWSLPVGATMRDLILAIRADEACHSHVNHAFSEMRPTDVNPFAVGAARVP